MHADRRWGVFTRSPNILILLTDQQRTTQHFPAGWVERNLPNLHRLQSSGVRFSNAMTNTTACSPSRAVLFTSTYPTFNGVTDVGVNLRVGEEIQLPNRPQLPLITLGKIFQDRRLLPPGVEYQVSYKGKWHLDVDYATALSTAQQDARAAQLEQNNQDMAATYGFPGWTSPDFGTAMAVGNLNRGNPAFFTLGGGVGANDVRVTQGVSEPSPNVTNAVDFLRAYAPNASKSNPFLLVVSLLNPHDIWVYPDDLEFAGYVRGADGEYPWNRPPFTELRMPPSFDLTLEQLRNKPSIQYKWRSIYRVGFTAADAQEYVRFYAYLETLTDALLGNVLAALDGNPHGIVDDTMIVRLADHGEMGQAQGGMIEKACEAYNEALLVPMIFSNPKLPQGAECTGLAGLIDIVPTLAAIAGIDIDTLNQTCAIQGTAIDHAILEPERETYPQLVFATDDDDAHLRCLIDNRELHAKYAVYYSAENLLGFGNPNGTASRFQYELYNYRYDRDRSPPAWDPETTNLIPVSGELQDAPALEPTTLRKWHAMHLALTKQLELRGQKPNNWPAPPPLPSGCV